MRESFNFQALYDIKLQFTQFLRQKATIYARCMKESYDLHTLYERKLQFTHFYNIKL
jgi:hypothetical protein